MIKKLMMMTKKWFGFKINNDLAKLFFLCNIPLDVLDYDDQQELTRKQQKYILLNLIKLCKKTNSKQIFYYMNSWAKDKEKKRGFEEFQRTFNYYFKFEKNFFLRKRKYLWIVAIF